MPRKAKQATYEEKQSRLLEIIEIMESPDTPLSSSMDLYREGVKLCAECAEMLDNIEQEIVVLKRNASGESLAPFTEVSE